MGEYIVTKTLNNNVVVCTNNDQEVILIGKGIGFNKKEGMTLNDQTITIEKIYKLESEQQKAHYKSLVEIADDNVLQVIIDSLNFISNTAMNVDSKQLVVSLTDHIISSKCVVAILTNVFIRIHARWQLYNKYI